MAAKTMSRFKLNDRVLIAAPISSIDAKYNGELGYITGFVQDWFVVVKINGKELRFRPDDLKICFSRS